VAHRLHSLGVLKVVPKGSGPEQISQAVSGMLDEQSIYQKNIRSVMRELEFEENRGS
jgi:hypothetical protein